MGKQKIAPKAAIFDRSTGECLDVEVAAPNKIKFTWIGGWMLLSFDGIRMIERARLRGQSLSILLCLMRHLDKNVVHNTTFGAIAAELDVDRAAVSRAVNQLEDAGLLMRGVARSVLYLNPHMCFRGQALDQRKAVNEWDRAHRPFALPSEVA